MNIFQILILVFAIIFPSPINAQESEIENINKKIIVDIENQILYAYENDQIVYKTKVSTGLIQTPTPTGDFKIYKKLTRRNMRGYSKVRGYYYLKNVPNVMYFYEGGYAIHGTYWHKNFGQRMSNGCINLPLESAKWLYEWTPLNTSLVVN